MRKTIYFSNISEKFWRYLSLWFWCFYRSLICYLSWVCVSSLWDELAVTKKLLSSWLKHGRIIFEIGANYYVCKCFGWGLNHVWSRHGSPLEWEAGMRMSNGKVFWSFDQTLIGLALSTLVRCACNDPMLSDDPKRKALPPSWGKSFADDIHSRHLNIDVNDRLLICDIFSPPPFPCFAIFNIPTTQGILVTLKSLMVTAPRE